MILKRIYPEYPWWARPFLALIALICLPVTLLIILYWKWEEWRWRGVGPWR